MRDAYLKIAAAEPERVRILDACGSIEETHVKVLEVVVPFLEERGLHAPARDVHSPLIQPPPLSHS